MRAPQAPWVEEIGFMSFCPDARIIFAKCLVAATIAVGGSVAFGGDDAVGDDDPFTRAAEVMQRRCLRCHNPVDLKGGLSLERHADLLDAGVIEPGKPHESRLLEVVAGSDGAPPAMPLSGPPLTPDDLEALRAWLAIGAPWPPGVKLEEPTVSDTQWWSLQRLRRVVPPTRGALAELAKQRHLPFDDRWVSTPVDAFIVEKLLNEGLTPSPAADRGTLIRRLYFDLLGLPPTPQQVREFVSDPDPLAYDRLVSRLLASPRHGERWARHWLDIAHYGDTHGFDKDRVRENAWPYRDYVIRSLNQDKPHERFILEQLAGDALFPDGPDGVVATGFLAAGPFDWVGQIEVAEGEEKKRVRNLDRDDMVATTMNAFVSLTAQCARCHNHKFDPISQADYYGLQAVFAAVDRADRPFESDPAVGMAAQALRRRIAATEQQLSELTLALHEDAGPELAKLDERLDALAERHRRRVEFGYHSGIESAEDAEKWVQVDLGEARFLDRLILVGCHDDFNGIGAGFGFPLRFRIEAGNDAGFRDKVGLVADHTAEDYANPGVVPQVFTPPSPIEARYVRVTATRLAPRQNDFIFALAEMLVLAPDGVNIAAGKSIESMDSIEARPRWAKSNLVDGYFHGAGDESELREALDLARQRAEILAKTINPAIAEQRLAARRALTALRAELAALPEAALVYAVAGDFAAQSNFRPTGGEPRPIYLLHRGNESQPDIERGPLAPTAISALDWLSGHFDLPPEHGEQERRIALARWIVDRENPLTWRSVVNRLWQHHFGRGLVTSPNDFGRMGEQPSHPELLDWLASEFLQSDQSWKRLHFLICTSAAYQQQSAERDEPARLDGGNRWLWRAPRRRVEAEAIRDSALMAAGLLRNEMGGPAFRSFGFVDDHSPHYRYDEYDPTDIATHRRSIYAMIVRSVPDPLMTALDCADPSLSVPERIETLTPLQALALMNHRLLTSVAQEFADRVARQVSDLPSQVDLAFELALSRRPTSTESAALLRLARQQGLVYCCRALFNLNEFVFVD